MIELDKCFNLETHSTDTHINFEKFQDDLVEIADLERQHNELTKIRNEQRDEEEIAKEEAKIGIPAQIGPTVSAMMKN